MEKYRIMRAKLRYLASLVSLHAPYRKAAIMDNPKVGNQIFIDDILRLVKDDFLYIMNGDKPINSPTNFKKSDAKTEIEWACNLIKRRLDNRTLYI